VLPLPHSATVSVVASPEASAEPEPEPEPDSIGSVVALDDAVCMLPVEASLLDPVPSPTMGGSEKHAVETATSSTADGLMCDRA
jgi:hypothetical protein